MSSFLDKKEGIFDPLKRYAFTNVTEAPFTFTWNALPSTVEAGETVELPEYLALHATRILVDSIMIGEAYADLLAKQKINPMYLEPKGAGGMGIPARRKPYEDRILKEIPMDKSSDRTLGIKRQQVIEELRRDLTAQPSEAGSVAQAAREDFIDIAPKVI